MWDVYVFGSGRREWGGGEWMRGLGLGVTNPVGTGGVLDVCVFWLRWGGWCRWGVGRGSGPGSGKEGWCYVCVSCKSGCTVYIYLDCRSRYLYIVLGGYLRI